MKTFDLVIIGAGTSGAYLAWRMAKRGFSVLVLEQLSREKVGTKYDIFHIEEKEFERLELPRPIKGDEAWAFEFEKNRNADPKNLFPKCQINPTVGLHLHAYTLLLNDLAKEAGAQILYDCAFQSFLTDECGRICGVCAKQGDETLRFGAQIVADCSGMAAVGRKALPAGYGIDQTALSDDEMFYVVLRYVKFQNAADYLDGSTFWAYYKAWIAPCADPTGAIIGIGACHSFENAERVFAELQKTIALPAYTLEKIERGRTPYTHNVYSMVADRFFVSGDAGNLTKSANGEGVTSSMVQIRQAEPILSRAIQRGNASAAALWEINRRYNTTQGAEFALLRALLVGVVNAAGFDEFQYAFESGIVSDELLGAMNGASVPAKRIFDAIKGFVSGLAGGRLRTAAIKAVLRAAGNAAQIYRHYQRFPKTRDGFEDWCKKADAIYEKIGTIR